MIWTILWVSWFILFAVVEVLALRNDMPGDTLSEHVRKWLSVKTKLGRTVFLIVWAGFTAWFGVHVLTGWV